MRYCYEKNSRATRLELCQLKDRWKGRVKGHEDGVRAGGLRVSEEEGREVRPESLHALQSGAASSGVLCIQLWDVGFLALAGPKGRTDS